jgi:ATP-dependent RNA helicase DeaD
MTTDFTQYNLHPGLIQSVDEMGYGNSTQVQENVIPPMLENKDLIVQSQTGSGKTAAFALPILQKLYAEGENGNVRALVLTPTRELAIQVAKAINQYGCHLNLKCMPVYGGQHYGTSRKRLKEGVDIIVGTPGRLQDLMRQKILDLGNARVVILDEADEMLSMGFIDDIENILSHTAAERQTALFSATIPKGIRHLAEKYMHKPEEITIARKHLTVASIDQRCYTIREKDKLAALMRLFEVEEIGATLVFTRTRAGSSRLANELVQRGIPSEALNGDLEQSARIRVLNRFREGGIKVLVATDVAARGLDIEDISHVFNYDLPTDPEAYVHRIGRTGRAGKDGIAISLATPGDARTLGRVERYIKQQIPRAELPNEEMVLEKRENKLVEKLEVWLQRDRARQEQDIVEKMVSMGHDPIKIAAAALRMARQKEKIQPVQTIGEVKLGGKDHSRSGKSKCHRKGNGRQPNRRKYANKYPKLDFSHEEGMVRLNLKRGRRDGIRPGEIVGEIANRASIPGKSIGKILIQDQHTLVDIPEQYVSRVLGQTGAYQFHGNQYVTIERA